MACTCRRRMIWWSAEGQTTRDGVWRGSDGVDELARMAAAEIVSRNVP
jgi:hypothetical protein